ncbi:MAG TPA: TPM domain-containing protein, partial [Actinoplanes sp.]
MSIARRALPALLAIFAAVLWAAPVSADPPSRLATQVTDTVGALSSGRSEVDAALERLRADTGIQLFVVFVDSFDGTPAQEWTDETARLSDLGDRDALLAVATQDRSYAYSFPDDPRISERELAAVARDDIEPALSRGDWSGAVVAAADGYRAAASGSSSLVWVVLVLAVVVVAGLIWVVVRRRRRRARAAVAAAPAAPAGPSTDELSDRANALLIELDDDLRASERELDLATAQYGAEATARFRTALDSARADVAEAFRLRMTLDEEPDVDEPTRRERLTAIIDRCTAADQRLDAESEDFDRLRDLEGRAAEVADEVDRRRGAL